MKKENTNAMFFSNQQKKKNYTDLTKNILNKILDFKVSKIHKTKIKR